jgi:ribosomal protein L37AE/L43A
VMAPDRPDLAATLAFAASELEDRGYPYAGVVRQAVRRLRDLEAQVPKRDSTCPRCGREVLQPGRGRPRIYCSRRCRDSLRRNAS